MRYDIRLRIGYDYGFPVRDAHHILRVSPRGDNGQRVEALLLHVSPTPHERLEETCFFGNVTQHLLLRQPHGEFSVDMLARVRVERPLPDLGGAPQLHELAAMAPRTRASGGDSPLHFLAASRLVAPLAAAGDYMLAGLYGATLGDALLAATRRIRDEFTYEPGLTSLHTSVAETLEARAGVCQDFAHLMISGLRALGVPAAYVSGFLRTDPPRGQARLEGADAMHAWVLAWLGPDLGWTGFDPTNGCLAGDGHIVVAIGRDYADIAPVAGVLTTTGPQQTRHAVDVVPAGEAPAPWQAALGPAGRS